MKRIALMLLFCLVPVALSDDTTKNGNIDYSGIYRVVGSEDGTEYSGAAVLIKKADNMYAVDTTSMGGHTTGIALIQDKTMSYGWVSGGIVGVTQYKIDGKKFSGVWTNRGAKGIRTERLEYLRNLDTDKGL